MFLLDEKPKCIIGWLIYENKKMGFGLAGVAFFITNLDHLFGLAYPENLSSIGLMVEAVDTLCGTGWDGTARARGRVVII